MKTIDLTAIFELMEGRPNYLEISFHKQGDYRYITARLHDGFKTHKTAERLNPKMVTDPSYIRNVVEILIDMVVRASINPSRVIVTCETKKEHPEEVREVYYQDLYIKIIMTQYVADQKVMALEINMTARDHGFGQDDDMKQRLLATKHAKPMFYDYHGPTPGPVERVELIDPEGVMEWLGIFKKEDIQTEINKLNEQQREPAKLTEPPAKR